MTTVETTPVRVLRPRLTPTARLACFSHAGGAADAFTALAAALPEHVELLAFQYPGRKDRRGEPFAQHIADLAEQAARMLAPYAGTPLSLLGHSMGALVAFETARRLEINRLFVSAALPPSDDWQESDLDTMADAEIVTELRRLGGVPEALLREPEVVEEILRLLRGDHRALRGYSCPPDALVQAPITVLLADADPKNRLDQMGGWARHTTRGCATEVFPGGHFTLVSGAPGVAELVAGTMARDLGPTPADLVRGVYLAGLVGDTPPWTTDLTALQDQARAVMTPQAAGYVIGDAGSGTTGTANRRAFTERRIVPRMLCGVDRRDLSVSLFGQRISAPVLLAPIASQTILHAEGELATVRGAADAGVPFVLSTGSSHCLEDVAASAGPAPRWFQLYLPSDRAVATSLVRRAEEAGYSAIVLTVDAPTFGYRPTDLDHGYLPFLHGAGIANFTTDPEFRAGLPDDHTDRDVLLHWAKVFANPKLTWSDLPWLRTVTSLPILLKGVLHPSDARRAMDSGAIDGLVVSNHGGRQLDGTIASLDALPGIREAVGADVPVLLDSGVRTGSDVVKALALGADAVLYGRPYLYGLALGGRDGVAHVLRCLLADLDLALGLAGVATPADLTADLLA